MIIKKENIYIRSIWTNLILEGVEDLGTYMVNSHWYVPTESSQFISAEKLYYKVKSYKKAKFYMMANSEEEYENYIKYFDKDVKNKYPELKSKDIEKYINIRN